MIHSINNKPSRLTIFLRSALNSIILYYIFFIFFTLYTLFFLPKINFSLTIEDIILGLLPISPYSLIILIYFFIPIWITNAIYSKIHPEYFLIKSKKNFITIFFLNIFISGIIFCLSVFANGGTLFSH